MTTRPNTVALRLTDEVVEWADREAAAAGLKRSVWLAEFLQRARDASPAGGPEIAQEPVTVTVHVDPGVAELIEADEPDRHDGLLAGDDPVPDLSLPDASEPDHAMTVEGGDVEMVASGDVLVRTVKDPAPAAPAPGCRHEKSKWKTMPYATICECGVRIR